MAALARAMLGVDGARGPRSPSRPQSLASCSLSHRRGRHARRRMHLQRHSRPQARHRRRAHAQSPVAVGASDDPRGGGVPRRAGAGRPRGAPLLQQVLDLAWPRLAWRRRNLSADEARDLVAAGRARPRILLGGADGLERNFREPRSPADPALRVSLHLDDWLRHDLCAPGRARRRDCRHPLDRAIVRLARQARDRRFLCRVRGAGSRRDRSRRRGRHRAHRLACLLRASRLAGVPSRRRGRADRAETLSLQSRRGTHSIRGDRAARLAPGGARRVRRLCRRRPSGSRR